MALIPPTAIQRAGFKSILVVSPHLDDGVFSCGALLAAHPQAVVATVFAGQPASPAPLTPWDRASGFGPGEHPMAERRREDASALALLGARPVWFDFLDAQYGVPFAFRSLVARIARTIADVEAEAVFVPLGLFHSDHRLTHEAALAARRLGHRAAWHVYEDAIYRRIDGLRNERLADLRQAGLVLTPLEAPGPWASSLKRHAVECYRSQLRALAAPGHPGFGDVFNPEAYWRLS